MNEKDYQLNLYTSWLNPKPLYSLWRAAKMYCSKCGSENTDDAIFCNSCGSSLKSSNKEINEKTVIKNENSKNKITLGLISSWLFGILFLLSGISFIFSGFFSAGIPLIVASFILLPPITKWTENKFNFQFSRGLRVTLVIGLFLIYAINLPTVIDDSNQNNYDSSSASFTSASQPEYYKVGEKVRVGNIEYTVNNVWITRVVGDQYMNQKADGVYLMVDLTIENVGSQSTDISSGYIKVIDSKGRVFESDSSAWIYLENNLLFKQIQPGLPTKGQTVFDVPEDESFMLQVTDSIWESKKKYIILGST